MFRRSLSVVGDLLHLRNLSCQNTGWSSNDRRRICNQQCPIVQCSQKYMDRLYFLVSEAAPPPEVWRDRIPLYRKSVLLKDGNKRGAVFFQLQFIISCIYQTKELVSRSWLKLRIGGWLGAYWWHLWKYDTLLSSLWLWKELAFRRIKKHKS